MRVEDFAYMLEHTLNDCRDILFEKAAEYAPGDDRLHNFKKAAALEGVSVKQAIGGMMVKHTVSLYDMLESPDQFPMKMWKEKIHDHINYLILLKAAVAEEEFTNGHTEHLPMPAAEVPDMSQTAVFPQYTGEES